MAMYTTVPLSDGISRQGGLQVHCCLSNFPSRKLKDISSVLNESASLWRFQFIPVTNLAHDVAFYGSFHGQILMSSDVPRVVMEDEQVLYGVAEGAGIV